MLSIPMLMILAGVGFLGYWLYKQNEAKKAIEEAEAMIPEDVPEGEEDEEKKEFIVTAAVGLGLIYFFPGAALFIIGIILLLILL